MKLRKKRTNKQTISIYFDKNYVYFRIYSCKNNNNIWFSILERCILYLTTRRYIEQLGLRPRRSMTSLLLNIEYTVLERKTPYVIV